MEEETPKTVWVTKYALTKGIFECEVVNEYASVPEGLDIKWPGKYGARQFMTPHDYSATREEAKHEAEVMRDKKIKSLGNQIEKLKAIVF